VIPKLLERLKQLFAGAPPPPRSESTALPRSARADDAPADDARADDARADDALADVPSAVDADAPPVAAPQELMTAPAQREIEGDEVAAREPQEHAPPGRVSSTAPAGEGVVLRLESHAEPVNFEVTRAGATLGRAADNGIRLDDLSVSRKHARIAYRQGAYWLSDVGSVGGTWVDGTKLNAPRRLAPGQVIDIGVCRLTVVSLAGTPTAPGRKRS